MLEKFIKDHIGKKNDNGYGGYPGECVSLVQRWNKVLGSTRQWGNGEAYRTNLVKSKLGVHVPLNQARAGDVIAGLNNSHIYGHVALIINSTQVLEQAGPTAGGDGIAKIGTIANFVKRYPDFKVTRLHAYKYVAPVAPTTPSDFIEEIGYQIVTNRLIEKRDNPSVSNPGKLVDVPKGTTLEVVGYQHAEGFLWRKLTNGQWISTGPSASVYDWAKLEPIKKDEQPKPKPPVTSGRQIGSTVVVNGKLFGNSSASSTGSVVHKNKKATIDKIVDDAKAPYHVTGAGLSGWGNESLFGGTVVETPKFKPYERNLPVGTILLKDDLKSAFALPIRAARTVTVVEEKNGYGKFVGGLIGAPHAWVKL